MAREEHFEEIPKEITDDMMNAYARDMYDFYYGEDPLTTEMRENGVSWNDFI